MIRTLKLSCMSRIPSVYDSCFFFETRRKRLLTVKKAYRFTRQADNVSAILIDNLLRLAESMNNFKAKSVMFQKINDLKVNLKGN